MPIVTGPLPKPIDGEHTEYQGFRNLTPHALRICGPLAPSGGADINLLPWPDLPAFRLHESSVERNAPGHNGFTLRLVAYDARDLPPATEGVCWIVSLPALMGLAAAGLSRPDIYAPDTSAGALRDQDGQILGVEGFVQLAP